MSSDSRRTSTNVDTFHGNSLFERAAFTIGIDDLLSRRLLWEACRASLTDPWHLTIDDLGVLLPEIDRRLRLLVPPDDADQAFVRIRGFVLSWEE